MNISLFLVIERENYEERGIVLIKLKMKEYLQFFFRQIFNCKILTNRDLTSITDFH